MTSEKPSQTLSHLRARQFHRAYNLPRLPREYYQGDAVVHWTMPIADRGTGWPDATFHARFREVMLHAAAREGLLCPTYCLMPDHMHLLGMGLHLDTDQRNGIKFLRELLGPALRPHRFQHQAHDHVLREHQRRRNAFSAACHYVLANPVRAELVSHYESWPFSGAVVPGYPSLHPSQPDFWSKFWKVHATARANDVGNIKRLPV